MAGTSEPCSAVSGPHRRTLLVVDTDSAARAPLIAALQSRGFEVRAAASGRAALAELGAGALAGAIIEQPLGDMSGLALLAALKAERPGLPVVILTARASVAEAVRAVKQGATAYLARPVTADQVLEEAGLAVSPASPPEEPATMSLQRAIWEYIQLVFVESGRSVRETARRLRLHRRTLQRMLAKNPPRL